MSESLWRKGVNQAEARDLTAFRACARGVAALEFALLAPLLALVLLGMADLGFATQERMALDHALRVGAQAAMEGAGEGRIERAISLALEDDEGRAWRRGETTIGVAQDCGCPENPDTPRNCKARCQHGRPMFVRYDLSAEAVFDGHLLPPMTLSSRLRVETR